METKFLITIPVLPSADIERDVKWYHEKMGMEVFKQDSMYAVLYRRNLVLHLQWHANTEDDPLLGGSVTRILVSNIRPLFDEFVGRGLVRPEKFRTGTAWGTDEFGFYDLNANAIFIVEDHD